MTMPDNVTIDPRYLVLVVGEVQALLDSVNGGGFFLLDPADNPPES